MTMNLRTRLTLALLVLLTAPLVHGATTLAALRAADTLRARIDIESSAPLYQRAPVLFAVEIATPRWFSRGTRVRDFRIPGAVVLPVSSFASNQTRTENGQSWAVQRWRFRLYAQEPGLLELPALQVFVSVNHDGGETVEGELRLTHPPLEIVAPPGSETSDAWLAATALRVEETWSGRQETYRVGDAITRRRRVVVEDAPGMMIPALTELPIPGLSLYASAPSVEDERVRGKLRGSRSEELVVTLEAAGDYTLPGARMYWFDTGAGEMRSEELPAYTFTVSAAAPAAGTGTPHWTFTRRDLLAGALALALLVAAAAVLRRLPWRAVAAPVAEALRLRRCRRAYLAALRRNDSAQALRLLDGIQRVSSLTAAVAGNHDGEQLLRQLLSDAYSAQTSPGSGLSRAQGLALWQLVGPRHRKATTSASLLSLNPPSSPQ